MKRTPWVILFALLTLDVGVAVSSGWVLSGGSINAPRPTDPTPVSVLLFIAGTYTLTDGPAAVVFAWQAENADGGCTGDGFDPTAPEVAGDDTFGSLPVWVSETHTFVYACAGSSDYGTTDQASFEITVTDTTPPDAPINLVAVPGSGDGEFSITFDPAPGPSSSEFRGSWYCNPPDVDYPGSDVEVWSGFAASGLPGGSSCFVRVRALDLAGNSSGYAVDSFTAPGGGG